MKAAFNLSTPVRRLYAARPVIFMMPAALLISSFVVSLPSALRSLFSKIQSLK